MAILPKVRTNFCDILIIYTFLKTRHNFLSTYIKYDRSKALQNHIFLRVVLIYIHTYIYVCDIGPIIAELCTKVTLRAPR